MGNQCTDLASATNALIDGLRRPILRHAWTLMAPKQSSTAERIAGLLQRQPQRINGLCAGEARRTHSFASLLQENASLSKTAYETLSSFDSGSRSSTDIRSRSGTGYKKKENLPRALNRSHSPARNKILTYPSVQQCFIKEREALISDLSQMQKQIQFKNSEKTKILLASEQKTAKLTEKLTEARGVCRKVLMDADEQKRRRKECEELMKVALEELDEAKKKITSSQQSTAVSSENTGVAVATDVESSKDVSMQILQQQEFDLKAEWATERKDYEARISKLDDELWTQQQECDILAKTHQTEIQSKSEMIEKLLLETQRDTTNEETLKKLEEAVHNLQHSDGAESAPASNIAADRAACRTDELKADELLESTYKLHAAELQDRLFELDEELCQQEESANTMQMAYECTISNLTQSLAAKEEELRLAVAHKQHSSVTEQVSGPVNTEAVPVQNAHGVEKPVVELHAAEHAAEQAQSRSDQRLSELQEQLAEKERQLHEQQESAETMQAEHQSTVSNLNEALGAIKEARLQEMEELAQRGDTQRLSQHEQTLSAQQSTTELGEAVVEKEAALLQLSADKEELVVELRAAEHAAEQAQSRSDQRLSELQEQLAEQERQLHEQQESAETMQAEHHSCVIEMQAAHQNAVRELAQSLESKHHALEVLKVGTGNFVESHSANANTSLKSGERVVGNSSEGASFCAELGGSPFDSREFE
jgi:hypothetical protein